MFKHINEEYNARKKANAERRMILEATMDVEEVIPGSEEDMENIVDADSVPHDVYKKIDAELNKIINDPDYDDDDAESMVDGDEDDIGDDEESIVDDDVLSALMNEAVTWW